MEVYIILGIILFPTFGSGRELKVLVLESFEDWRSFMRAGKASAEIPLMEPYLIPVDIAFPLSESPIGNYRIILSKLSFTGLSTFRVKKLGIDPLSRALTFTDGISNFSTSGKYRLMYRIPGAFPLETPVTTGSLYGAISGTVIDGKGTILPSPPDWFKISSLQMTLSWESMDLRIYPDIPLINDPNLVESKERAIYDEIQKLQPNLSKLCKFTYSKTLEIKFNF